MSLPLGTEQIVALAAADPDLRVLRRAIAPTPVPMPRGSLLLSCCALEGVRHDGEHGLRGVSLRPFLADTTGMVVEVGRPRRWTAADVPVGTPEGGCETCCDAEAASLLVDAELLVAHDARTLRPLVERAFVEALAVPWICTLRDVDWCALGLEAGTLAEALHQVGHFIATDEPEARVDGLLRLLDHRPTPLGSTLLGRLLASACRPTWFVEVEDLTPAGERMVATAGYAFVPGAGRWWREIGAADLHREVEWLTWEVCTGAARPRVREIDWRSRHALH